VLAEWEVAPGDSAHRASPVLLESAIKEFMAMMPKKEKQFCSFDTSNGILLK
jgi:hypothetical protein